MDIAIYEKEDKTLCILTPTDGALKSFSILDIAKKDVPAGLPFWIKDSSELPADRTYRDAWRLDGTEGEPDGHGGDA